MNKSLTDLANFHATDKGTVGPSIAWGAHNYTDIYEAYLAGLREAPANILEIGLGVTGDQWVSRIVHGRNPSGGASLKMWYDYFSCAKIYGIDVNACIFLDNDRIKTLVADQGNIEDLAKLDRLAGDSSFDVIIDDGSHRPDHQQISLSYLFKKLKNGGLYFIEDLGNNGLGDNRSGRGACNSVINTRRLLKGFMANGAFEAPNALADELYMKEHIASVAFHAPRQTARLSRRKSLRNPFIIRTAYLPDSESLCVIRKK